ncbi:MAG: mevalonate kinase [Candidatus Helarchaeota archaeon]|nr:mevalonate kinase [Candidatus Helarchaeota archaeon]
MISCTASAPGKCILVGEHAVVYGTKAIVTALNLRAYTSIEIIPDKKIDIEAMDYQLHKEFPYIAEIKLDKKLVPLKPIVKCCQMMINKFKLNKGMKLRIWSEIPPSAGLGSSAAVFVATVKAIETAFDLNLTNDEISQMAFDVEKIVHTKPSGIDNFICTHGGCIQYSKSEEIKRVELPKNFPLIICNSEKPRNTGILVEKVAKLHKNFPRITKKIFDAINLLSMNALESLKKGDLVKLGEIFNLNQGLLEALGVSTSLLSQFINIAREKGAYGAKLTGAGGGGCIIAISPPAKQINIISALKKIGGVPILTEFAKDGVKVEKLK